MANNYIIGNNESIDFYGELYKSLDEILPETNEDLCLITNSPLLENYIQLECKHKFNYIPLYNDIVNHKKSFNRLERRILKSSEIRCPYCRNIQTTLLPYYELVGVKQVHGVNFFDEKQENININGTDFVKGKCGYITYTDVKTLEQTFCSNTKVKMLDVLGKTYCASHYYYACKNHAQMEKIQAAGKAKQEKEKAKLEKEKVKEQAKLAKEQLKQAKEQLKQTKEQLKLEKEQLKLENKTKISNTQENHIINVDGCQEILKSGSKKGQSCGCKIKQDGFCGRHIKA